MSELQTIIGYVYVWFGSLSAEDWAVVITVIGSILSTIAVTAWIKRHYLRKNAKKLASEFIVLNVTFWSFLSSVAGFLVLNGSQFATMLPFISLHAPQITAGAIAVHAIATALHKWWRDRKDGKPLLPLDTNTDGIVDTSRLFKAEKPPIPAVSQDIWSK